MLFKQFISQHSYTYPLWKTPAITFTNPEDSSSFADKEDFVCFSVTIPSASTTSQSKTPAGSDGSNVLFLVWAFSATPLSMCDLLRTQIHRMLKNDPDRSRKQNNKRCNEIQTSQKHRNVPCTVLLIH